MQIFPDKKWITGAIYEPKRAESIIMDDYDPTALAIQNGADFDIVDGAIVIQQ